MAVDTAAKRFALLALCAPSEFMFLPNDDDMDTAADRAGVLNFYAGLTASGGGSSLGVDRRRRAFVVREY